MSTTAPARRTMRGGFARRLAKKRSVAATLVVGLVASLLGAAVPLALASPASAAPGDPFSPDRPTVFVSQSQTGANTGLFRTETTGAGSFEFEAEGGLSAGRYNAISWNPNDGYIYGIATETFGAIPYGAVIRIGQEGLITRVGNQTLPGTMFAGGFNPVNGRLYVSNGNAGTQLHSINLSPGPSLGTFTSVATSGQSTGYADFEWQEGYFWTIGTGGGTIMRIASGGQITEFPFVIPGASGSIGAAWTFGNGNLGFAQNDNGAVYQVRITNHASASPTFELVSTVDGRPANQNDGTAIPGLPTDLQLDKQGPATFTPGDRITYTLSVTNNGPGESSGWIVDDEIPAGLTDPQVTSEETCDVAPGGESVRCSGGRLTAGETRTITISALTDVDERGCIENIARVTANESDTNPENDEDSALSCARLLEVSKTSSAGASSSVGDVVDYTVTVTNPGSGDFSTDEPASFSDDLSDVLDDASWNDDVAVTVSDGSTVSTPTLSGRQLSWSGPLAGGQSATFTYSVTLGTGGDGVVGNAACVPAELSPSAEPCADTETLLPRLTIAKTAHTTELPVDGGQVVYTVVVTNQGPGAAVGATFSDDLSDVLDDGDLVAGSVASSTGAASVSGTDLTWTSDLAAGASATITYTVTYDATAGGDNVLRNAACLPLDLAADPDDPCSRVQVPGAALQQWKTSDPESGAVLDAGDEITYTLHFRHLGAAAATVDNVDDLSDVLDDAELVAGPTVAGTGLSAVLDGDEIGVTGSVAVGETVTVSYTVRVLPYAQQGDHTIGNALAECDEANQDRCETEHLIRHLTLEKTSTAASSSTVGDVVTYEVTVTNDGSGDYTVGSPATVADDLAGVLDDATWNDDASAASGTVSFTEPTLTWSGALAAGDSVTITYSVTLTNAGDGTVANVACAPNPGDDESCASTETLLPKLTLTKVADTTELPVDGGTVTYTLTVINEGPGDAAEATISDDLSDVLDDGDFVDASLTATSGSVTRSGETITWSGALAVDATSTIAYSVVYDANAGGTNQLVNTACLPADLAQDPDDPCRQVFVPGAQLEQWKSVDPADGSVVQAGDLLTYTLHFRNSGEAPALVDNSDDLSGVLDDADLVSGPNSSGAGLAATLDGETVRVSGTVPVGAETQVTYTVQVRPYAAQGDHVLTNALADCEPVGDQLCEVENPIRHLAVSKASDAGESAAVGDVVTYTVTVTNDGEGDYTEASPATMVDDLSAVLDDATWNDDVTAEAGDAMFASPTLVWSGPIAAGESVDIVYSVTLTASGDGSVVNSACVANAGEDTACASTETSSPRLTIAKTSDTVDLPENGGIVGYTITVTNEGPGDATASNPARISDDLSDVLDDAVFDDASLTSSVGSAGRNGDELTWSGALAAGESATISYSVVYDATLDGTRQLLNTACLPLDLVSDPDAACQTVSVPAAFLQQWKTSDPASGESVAAGDQITYTLHFRSSGTATSTVDNTDDLSAVLDDAELIAGPTPSTDELAVSLVDETLSVTGQVPAGAEYTVSYTVQVRPFAEQGDHVMTNALAECLAPEGETCEPIEHTARHLVVVKTSDASASARVGQTVEYTVEVTNDGAGDYTAAVPAAVVDDLAGVLDDATWNDDATASVSDGSAADAPTLVGTELSWSGPLAAGETVTLTYTVTLTNAGDGLVANTACVANPGEDAACAETQTALPKLTVDKVADTAEAPAAGTTIGYTIVVTNEGPGDATADNPATITDDLSDVLDDAVFDDASLAASGGTVVRDGDQLVWTGPLAAGASVEITYEVTYEGDGEGSSTLVNSVCLPADLALDPTDPCRVVEVPGAALQQWKSSSVPSGTALVAGDELTYTLHFRNVGAATADVSNSDDLTGVLDDADIVVEPAASADSLTVTRDGSLLTIAGTVPAGEEYSVTYTVRVRDAADRGDDILVNALAECDDANEERCSTEHPVRHLSVAKEADTQEVRTGDTVTYTVTVTNDGAADFTAAEPALVRDDLSGVLDDATWDGAVEASTGAVEFTAPTLTWGGELAVGESVTIVYTVTVTNEGDQQMLNVVCAQNGTESTCATVELDLPRVVATKSSDPASGTDVMAGQEIVYTLTWTNEGRAVGEVDATDDLSGVLDDASLTGAPVSDDAEVAVEREGDTLRITGPIQPGATVTVTYAVTVAADGERGDNVLRNALVPDEPCSTGTCPPPTEHPVGELRYWKSVDPASGSTIRPGGSVTYTLHFENIGEGSIGVSVDDVLTDVLDDADVTTMPAASRSSLTAGAITDGRFAVTGSLTAGESATVSYSVTVRGDGERGDDRLGNVLVPAGEDVPPGGCTPEGEFPTCTLNPIADLLVTKSSDPASGSSLDPGEIVTYTLTFANTSLDPAASAVPVDHVDHMTDVLDDADLVETPRSSSEAVTASVEGDTIRIVGDVAVGSIVTVTYAVQVKPWAAQGDHSLGNVVAEAGQEPFCVEDSPLCTWHSLREPPPLASTGGGMVGGGLLAIAFGLVFGGAVMIVAFRSRGRRGVEETARG